MPKCLLNLKRRNNFSYFEDINLLCCKYWGTIYVWNGFVCHNIGRIKYCQLIHIWHWLSQNNFVQKSNIVCDFRKCFCISSYGSYLKYVGHKCLVELHHSSKKSTIGLARLLLHIEYFKFISSCSAREAPTTTQSPLSPFSWLWWYIHL